MYSARMSVHIVPHPLIHDALIQLRDVRTETEEFRRIANRISVLLVAEALRDLPTERAVVETPIERAEGRRVARDVVVVPVLRAGLGMLDAVLELLPSARVGHIGLQRNESTAVASQYYAKLPDNLPSSYVVLVDPMLATGGSAVAALDVSEEGRRQRTSASSASSPRPKGWRWSSSIIPMSRSTRPSSTKG